MLLRAVVWLTSHKHVVIPCMRGLCSCWSLSTGVHRGMHATAILLLREDCCACMRMCTCRDCCDEDTPHGCPNNACLHTRTKHRERMCTETIPACSATGACVAFLLDCADLVPFTVWSTHDEALLGIRWRFLLATLCKVWPRCETRTMPELCSPCCCTVCGSPTNRRTCRDVSAHPAPSVHVGTCAVWVNVRARASACARCWCSVFRHSHVCVCLLPHRAAEGTKLCRLLFFFCCTALRSIAVGPSAALRTMCGCVHDVLLS